MLTIFSSCPEIRAIARARIHARAKSTARAIYLPCKNTVNPAIASVKFKLPFLVVVIYLHALSGLFILGISKYNLHVVRCTVKIRERLAGGLRFDVF